jgi:hypothetical protein
MILHTFSKVLSSGPTATIGVETINMESKHLADVELQVREIDVESFTSQENCDQTKNLVNDWAFNKENPRNWSACKR